MRPSRLDETMSAQRVRRCRRLYAPWVTSLDWRRWWRPAFSTASRASGTSEWEAIITGAQRLRTPCPQVEVGSECPDIPGRFTVDYSQSQAPK